MIQGNCRYRGNGDRKNIAIKNRDREKMEIERKWKLGENGDGDITE